MSHAFADTRADTRRDEIAPQLDALAERVLALSNELQGFADVPDVTRAYLVQRTALIAARARAISRQFDGRTAVPRAPHLDLEPFALVGPNGFAGSAVQ